MMKKRFDVSQLYTFIRNVSYASGNKKKLLFLSIVKEEEGKGGKKKMREGEKLKCERNECFNEKIWKLA